MLHATRQGQCEHHSQNRAHKGRTGHAQTHPHLHGPQTAAKHAQVQGHAQGRARGAAQQIWVGQRVAKQSLRDRASQAQQSTPKPSAQAARQTDVDHDLVGQFVGLPPPSLPTLAARGRAQEDPTQAHEPQAQGPAQGMRLVFHGRTCAV